ncbi:MAG TPA: chorismate lyase [Limnobacter sp.]|nr:chorismate lyase [Limnobacter sp.]
MTSNRLWTRHCPASWPLWAKEWARTQGSLTRRLVGLGAGFQVEPVLQSSTRTGLGPGLPPELTGGGMMRQRLVRLKVGGQAVVLAQTLIRMDGPVNDWRFWRGLGNRSLGSVLFSDPQVQRGALYFARLPANQAWVVKLLPPELRQPALRAGPAPLWFARCARFSRKPHRTPLWVMEVFLPQLETYL